MTYWKKTLCFLLSAALLLSLIPAAGAAERVRAVVTFAEGAAVSIPEKAGVEVLYTYDTLFSGAAVEGSAAAVAALERLPGVSGVLPTESHALPMTIDEPLVSSNSLPLMGGSGVTSSGEGMVIAVIDSGLLCSHEAFRDYALTDEAALTADDIAAFTAGGGTPGRYVSRRIPFVYDYSSGDDDVYTVDDHGTHVSALAAGYALQPDGAVTFRGAAPAAQLLGMKVFPDDINAGADDADILKALDDACALGADVICLSLGVESGFTGDNNLGGLYCDAFRRLREEGIILCCAAGNTAVTTASKAQGSLLPSGSYTDYGTISAPASYPGATGIAAAEALIYESSNYIRAGERDVAFIPAQEELGRELPALTALAGEGLAFVAVPGLGRAEDYAGLDLRGKVALVRRGEITFTEKIQNAAAAGAVACLICNSSDENVIPSVTEKTDIPGAIISLSDSEYLLALPEGSTLTVHTGSFLKNDGDQPAMMAWSAWGPTTDLRLSPALTAPGGNIISASVAGDSLYEQLSGTSMAAPNAAGAFALVLERAYGEGITDKREAADLAEALLTGTARLLRDEKGTPLSPRQQGAGLIDLEAALTCGVVIDQPLLACGDSLSGTFTLSFVVKNLGTESVELAVDVTALTDDWQVDGEGRAYSLMTPADITDQILVSGPSSVEVAGGSQRQVTLRLAVSDELKQTLRPVYPNGFYTEGYITLTDGGENSVHATFLGYCGDWEQAPVIDQTDFRDYLEALYLDTPMPTPELGANLAYLSGESFALDSQPLLGENPMQAVDVNEARFAIPTAESDAFFTAGSLFTVDLYTLRNAPHLIMLVYVPSTGAICYVDDTQYLPKAGTDPYTGYLVNSGWFWWSGTDAAGNILPDGTQARVAFYAWPESDDTAQQLYERSGCDPTRPESYRFLLSGSMDRCVEWSFPVTVDRSAPTVSAAIVGDELRLRIADDRFLAHAAVLDEDNWTLAEKICADDAAGATHTIALPLAELTDTVTVTVMDYATNMSAYTIDLAALAGGAADSIHLCASGLLPDVDGDDWFHPAVDFLWSAGLVGDDEEFRFVPDASATRADVLAMLYRLAGRPAAEGTVPFTDARASEWYYPALVWAYQQELVSGLRDDFFGAFASVSRQQLAAILWRYAGQPEADAAALDAFSDSAATEDWARTAVAWAVETGIFSGRSDGRLDPLSRTTRAELAQVMMNFLQE